MSCASLRRFLLPMGISALLLPSFQEAALARSQAGASSEAIKVQTALEQFRRELRKSFEYPNEGLPDSGQIAVLIIGLPVSPEKKQLESELASSERDAKELYALKESDDEVGLKAAVEDFAGKLGLPSDRTPFLLQAYLQRLKARRAARREAEEALGGVKDLIKDLPPGTAEALSPQVKDLEALLGSGRWQEVMARSEYLFDKMREAAQGDAMVVRINSADHDFRDRARAVLKFSEPKKWKLDSISVPGFKADETTQAEYERVLGVLKALELDPNDAGVAKIYPAWDRLIDRAPSGRDETLAWLAEAYKLLRKTPQYKAFKDRDEALLLLDLTYKETFWAYLDFPEKAKWYVERIRRAKEDPGSAERARDYADKIRSAEGERQAELIVDSLKIWEGRDEGSKALARKYVEEILGASGPEWESWLAAYLGLLDAEADSHDTLVLEYLELLKTANPAEWDFEGRSAKVEEEIHKRLLSSRDMVKNLRKQGGGKLVDIALRLLFGEDGLSHGKSLIEKLEKDEELSPAEQQELSGMFLWLSSIASDLSLDGPTRESLKILQEEPVKTLIAALDQNEYRINMLTQEREFIARALRGEFLPGDSPTGQGDRSWVYKFFNLKPGDEKAMKDLDELLGRYGSSSAAGASLRGSEEVEKLFQNPPKEMLEKLRSDRVAIAGPLLGDFPEDAIVYPSRPYVALIDNEFFSDKDLEGQEVQIVIWKEKGQQFTETVFLTEPHKGMTIRRSESPDRSRDTWMIRDPKAKVFKTLHRAEHLVEAAELDYPDANGAVAWRLVYELPASGGLYKKSWHDRDGLVLEELPSTAFQEKGGPRITENRIWVVHRILPLRELATHEAAGQDAAAIKELYYGLVFIFGGELNNGFLFDPGYRESAQTVPILYYPDSKTGSRKASHYGAPPDGKLGHNTWSKSGTEFAISSPIYQDGKVAQRGVISIKTFAGYQRSSDKQWIATRDDEVQYRYQPPKPTDDKQRDRILQDDYEYDQDHAHRLRLKREAEGASLTETLWNYIESLRGSKTQSEREDLQAKGWLGLLNYSQKDFDDRFFEALGATVEFSMFVDAPVILGRGAGWMASRAMLRNRAAAALMETGRYTEKEVAKRLEGLSNREMTAICRTLRAEGFEHAGRGARELSPVLGRKAEAIEREAQGIRELRTGSGGGATDAELLARKQRQLEKMETEFGEEVRLHRREANLARQYQKAFDGIEEWKASGQANFKSASELQANASKRADEVGIPKDLLAGQRAKRYVEEANALIRAPEGGEIRAFKTADGATLKVDMKTGRAVLFKNETLLSYSRLGDGTSEGILREIDGIVKKPEFKFAANELKSLEEIERIEKEVGAELQEVKNQIANKGGKVDSALKSIEKSLDGLDGQISRLENSIKSRGASNQRKIRELRARRHSLEEGFERLKAEYYGPRGQEDTTDFARSLRDKVSHQDRDLLDSGRGQGRYESSADPRRLAEEQIKAHAEGVLSYNRSKLVEDIISNDVSHSAKRGKKLAELRSYYRDILNAPHKRMAALVNEKGETLLYRLVKSGDEYHIQVLKAGGQRDTLIKTTYPVKRGYKHPRINPKGERLSVDEWFERAIEKEGRRPDLADSPFRDARRYDLYP